MSSTVAEPVAVRATKPAPSAMMRAIKPLASLRLTVWLFSLSLVLVFVGTLAQMDAGIHTVVKQYFRSWFVFVPFQLFVRLGQVFFGVPSDAHVNGVFPFPAGWTLGTLLLANLLAAHLVRFRASWRRSGILLIHGGLVVLLLSELVTGLCAIEARMSINEGESSDYAFRIHEVELAFVDKSASDTDAVVVVPQSKLQKPGTISDPLLPVDIEVVRYMKNADFRKPSPDANNPATAGNGLRAVAIEAAENPGTSSNIDIVAAYFTLRDKKTGAVIGTFLGSPHPIFNPDTVEIGGKTYEMALRFRRDYKPYRIQLIEFRFDRYQGTEIAKNYSSKVRLIDPTQNVDREVTISMNAPLRYEGETFYQQGFDEQTEKATVLQVVRNPAWTWPYIACFLVTFGMIVHFGLHLHGFLQRRAAR
jgi:ResB-like family